MTNTRFTPAPRKAWKRFIPHAVVGLVFLGIGSALGNTTETVVEKPVEVVKEVAVETTVVPSECLAALDDADTEFAASAVAWEWVGNMLDSLEALDFDGAEISAQELEKAVGDMWNTDYRANADSCREAAK